MPCTLRLSFLDYQLRKQSAKLARRLTPNNRGSGGVEVESSLLGVFDSMLLLPPSEGLTFTALRSETASGPYISSIASCFIGTSISAEKKDEQRKIQVYSEGEKFIIGVL